MKIPQDFGEDLLSEDAFNDLNFLAKDGEIGASSIIIAANSPVIRKLVTGEQRDLIVETEEFSKASVTCFLRACYIGSVTMLNMAMFREVNKMAHLFQVKWLQIGCQRFFARQCEKLTEADTDTAAQLFEEAAFSITKSKDRKPAKFLHKALYNLDTIRHKMISEQLSRFETASPGHLEIAGMLTGQESHVAIRAVCDQLRGRSEGHDKSLSEKIRAVITPIAMKRCFDQDIEQYYAAFEVLQRIGEVNHALWISLEVPKLSQITGPRNNDNNLVKPANEPYHAFRYDFEPYQDCTTLQEVVEKLNEDVLVCSLTTT